MQIIAPTSLLIASLLTMSTSNNIDKDVVDVLAAADGSESSPPAKRKRICKFPGCDKSVKSQGHCQRHGAKAKRCKIHDCPNQAQGSHKGHCKRHYRELFSSPSTQKYSPRKKTQEIESLRTCDPIGVSVYDNIIPSSFAWKMEGDDINKSPKKGLKLDGGTINPDESAIDTEFIPILQHLVDNEALDFGWHRTAERLSQGNFYDY